jgi:hypothetical protein
MVDVNASAAVIDNIGRVIAAIAGLGTASMGLVDATKAFFGGPSNFGFGSIKKAITPFLPPDPGSGAFNRTVLLQTLRANWLNGVPKADQKAKAKALVHLGLSKGNAESLAKAAGVDTDKLKSLAEKTADGRKVDQDEINVLGQFDAVLSAVLDNAYERGDQIYRNGSKLLAMILSTILGVIGAVVLGQSSWLGLAVGIVATPLAPVSKDLVSSLQAAVNALQTARRGLLR